MIARVSDQDQLASDRGRAGWVARARRVLRRAEWRLRAPWVRNPPLAPKVTSILFVCKGNICRSPFASLLAQRLADEVGAGISCASAGQSPSRDGCCPPEAVRAAAAFGVGLASHAPVSLDHALMEAHDLVVVMEAAQLFALRRRWPQFHDRIVLLALFESGSAGSIDSYERAHIADPFGRGVTAFEQCYRRLDCSVRDLLTRIRGNVQYGNATADKNYT